MFCPVCHAEYRQGTFVCADCNVALEPALPHVPGESEDDPFCAFWEGDDPRLHAELCALLEDEGIHYKTVQRGDHLFNIVSQPAFQIGVPFSLFERAEAAVKEAFGSDPAEQDSLRLLSTGKNLAEETATVSTSLNKTSFQRGISSQPSTEQDDSGGEPSAGGAYAAGEASSRSGWDPDDWYSEDATVEVWKGDSPAFADLLSASLRENRIHCRADELSGEHLLYVLPPDEPAAREILREITEGVPPE
ncbi:MAG TPA: hypothetical protein VHE23_01760 [Candidatus Acidoferrales bacterium]|nr:hypothetical protein [Candidatus Acidoferrales bacterium]